MYMRKSFSYTFFRDLYSIILKKPEETGNKNFSRDVALSVASEIVLSQEPKYTSYAQTY